MNKQNKAKNLKPAVEADGDSSINTKKGFLISLPSKKRDTEVASGIVMAKTMPAGTEKNTSGAHENRKPPKNNSPKAQRDAGDKNPKEKQPQHQNTGKNQNQNEPKNPKDNRENRENAKRRPAKNGAGHPNSPNPSKNAQNTAPNNAQTKKGEQDRQNKPHNGGTGGKKNNNRNNPQKDAGGAAQPKNSQNPGKNQHNQKPPKQVNDRNEKNAGGKKKNGKNDRRDRRKEPRMASLSPLSGDMLDFGKTVKSEDIARMGGAKAPKEPSLEEKYKNAVPLAEQIAAEESARKDALRIARVKVTPNGTPTEKTDGKAVQNVESGQNAEQGVVADTEKPDYEIVGVRFREAGKIYYFDPDGKNIPYGTPVIVETSRGSEYGLIAISNRIVPHDSIVAPLKKLKRIATATDTEKYHANKELEGEAAGIFKQKVKELGLEMNLVFVEYTFDNSKLLFYFTAESRIDFRELVKELAAIFRTRIELRQIGVRDEAKLLGGLGVCGRTVCCNAFLGDFAQVSIKMAKDQGLSLNSAKISGACGKLMCCLRFEDKVYSEEMARTPKVGSVVETPDGKGTVTEAHPLKGEVKVSLESEPETPAKTYHREDVTIVGFNKGAAKAVEEDLGELAALEDKQ